MQKKIGKKGKIARRENDLIYMYCISMRLWSICPDKGGHSTWRERREGMS